MREDLSMSGAPFPSRDELIEYIREHGNRISRRDLARAFSLDADQRVALRTVLKDLAAEGVLQRGRGRRYGEPLSLPSVAVVEICGIDTDGETLAKPVSWAAGVPPLVYLSPDKRSRAAFAPGDRALVRLRQIGSARYEGRVIRRLAGEPPRTLGVVSRIGTELRLLPIDKRSREEMVIPPDASMDAKPGDLVWAELRSVRPLGLKEALVVEHLGPAKGPKSITHITLHDHAIPRNFSADALADAKACGPAPLANREDLRAIPLVTIDGADARDFDDAVWAEQDPSPDNAGGWHLVVAIADVAWYVRAGSALDRSAFERGNSVYFPDCVVPMLPFELSSGWCSLVPGEDRPCLAVHLWISAEGSLLRHGFVRGMMRSAARLTYSQVQDAYEERPDDTTAPLIGSVVKPLSGAYQALHCARMARGVLELDVPERRVRIGPDGTVDGIELRERFDSHKLIEEFMILANVAAAETLEGRAVPCMYRVHDQPSIEKLVSLREFLGTLGLRLPPGRMVRPTDFNRVLAAAAGTPEARLVNEVVLRSQAQAMYDPANIGHFGLALRRYCHFTSPIRRYADVLVHRALIDTLKLGDGGLGSADIDFERVGVHISGTERRAAAAERDAVDRFTAAFLAEQVGLEAAARISGVTRFGLFVTLDDTGADGLVPIATLPNDYYVHEEEHHRLVGRNSGLVFRLGDRVDVRLAEANPLTGGIRCEILRGVPEAGGRAPRTRVGPVRQGRNKSRPKSGASAKRKPNRGNRRSGQP
jgi:ribonuclease R